MKRGVILVNTGRGAIVDAYLSRRPCWRTDWRVQGLDVLNEEPPSELHPFYSLGNQVPNLIITPHMVVTAHSARVMIMTALEEIVRFLEGGRPRFPLNEPMR